MYTLGLRTRFEMGPAIKMKVSDMCPATRAQGYECVSRCSCTGRKQ